MIFQFREFEKVEVVNWVDIDNNTYTDVFRDMQRALWIIGYKLGTIDGLIGPKTKNALFSYVTDFTRDNYSDKIKTTTLNTLATTAKSYSNQTDQNDFSTVDGTINAIIAECKTQHVTQLGQIAYILATVKWETAHTFKPIRESIHASEKWRRDHFRYYPYYGRGFVQITWLNNYTLYGAIMGENWATNPDLALEPNRALFALVHGFRTGAFTGCSIYRYVEKEATFEQFIQARRCINGTKHATEIANIAKNYHEQLETQGEITDCG